MEKMKSIVFRELPVHDTMWSITTGRDGNIYAGICGELTGGLSAFIARYCPDKERIDYLLEVSPVLGEQVIWHYLCLETMAYLG